MCPYFDTENHVFLDQNLLRCIQKLLYFKWRAVMYKKYYKNTLSDIKMWFWAHSRIYSVSKMGYKLCPTCLLWSISYISQFLTLTWVTNGKSIYALLWPVESTVFLILNCYKNIKVNGRYWGYKTCPQFMDITIGGKKQY